MNFQNKLLKKNTKKKRKKKKQNIYSGLQVKSCKEKIF